MCKKEKKSVVGRTWALVSSRPAFKSHSSVPYLCDSRSSYDLEHYFNLSEPQFPQVGDGDNQ